MDVHWKLMYRFAKLGASLAFRFNLGVLLGAAFVVAAQSNVKGEYEIAPLKDYAAEPFYVLAQHSADAKFMPRGPLESLGVPFLVEDFFRLTDVFARDERFTEMPPLVPGIEVGDDELKSVHLIAYTHDPAPRGSPALGIRFNYTDGSHEFGWLLSEIEIGDHRGYGVATVNGTARQAWAGVSQSATARGRYLRCFHSEIQNPSPEKSVSHVDLLACYAGARIIIGAVTLETLSEDGPAMANESGRNLANPIIERKVRVMDETTDTLVVCAEIQVRLRREGAEDAWIKGFRTDASGNALLHLPKNRLVLGLRVLSGAHLPLDVDARTSALWKPTEDEAIESTTVSIEPGPPFGGRVTDILGEPVPNAKISVSQIARVASGFFEERRLGLVTADATGAWDAGCVAGSFDNVLFSVVGDGYIPKLFEPQLPSAGSPHQVSVEDLEGGAATFELEESLSCSGVVTYLGNPVGGAHVDLILGIPTNIPTRRTYTNEDGEFRIDGVEPGSGYLLIDSEVAAPKVMPAQWLIEDPELDIELGAGTPRQGRVVGLGGRPIPNAFVFPTQWSQGPGLHQHLRTDENGEFEWEHAPDGEILVHAAILGRDLSSPHQLKMGEEPTVIRISNPGPQPTRQVVSRTFQVVDAETGDPIESFDVIPGSALGGADTYWMGHNRVQGSNGRATYQSPGASISRLRFGIEAEGYAPQVVDSVTAGGPTKVSLAPASGLALNIDRGSTAIGKALDVYLLRARERIGLNQQGEINTTHPGIRRVRLPSSESTLEHLRPLALESVVVVGDGVVGIAHVEPDQSAVSVQMTASGTIQGRVAFQSGFPNVSAQIMQLYQGASYDSVPLSPMPVEIGDDGRFEWRGVPPSRGSLALMITVPRTPSSPYGIAKMTHSQSFEVLPGATTELILGASGRTVIGSLKPDAELSEESGWFDRLANAALHPIRDNPGAGAEPPERSEFESDAAHREALQAFVNERNAWTQSPEGIQWRLEAAEYALELNKEESSFRIPAVPPGDYELRIFLNQAQSPVPGRGDVIVRRRVEIPEGEVGAPFDLGEFAVEKP